MGFVVIGVLEEQGGASEADDQLLVPLSATAGRLRFLYTPAETCESPRLTSSPPPTPMGSGSRKISVSCCSTGTTRPSRTS